MSKSQRDPKRNALLCNFCRHEPYTSPLVLSFPIFVCLHHSYTSNDHLIRLISSLQNKKTAEPSYANQHLPNLRSPGLSTYSVSILPRSWKKSCFCTMRTPSTYPSHPSTYSIRMSQFPEEALNLSSSEGFGYFPGYPGQKLNKDRYEIVRKLGFGPRSSTWLVVDSQCVISLCVRSKRVNHDILSQKWRVFFYQDIYRAWNPPKALIWTRRLSNCHKTWVY